MGAAPSNQLQSPRVPVVCIESKFALPYEIELKLKEKIFSMREDSSVTNCADGSLFFSIRGTTFSIHDKKILYDNNGSAVCNLQEKLVSVWQKYCVRRGDGNHVIARFSVKLFSLFDRALMTAKFRNQSDQDYVTLKLKGDWRNKNGRIILDNRDGQTTVALISRQVFNLRNLFLDRDQYVIRIAAGVDIALIIMFCLALDDRKDKN